MSPGSSKMARSLPVVAALLVLLAAIPSASQREEPAPTCSRIALKLNNLLIVGNRISMAIACIVQTPLKDAELVKRGIDPAQWRRDYCRQSLAIVEPWAREFRKHGNFQLLP